jgi:hypothetical protein
MMRNIAPFIYVFAVYAIASVFGMMHHIHSGFLFETPIWSIFKLMLRDSVFYGTLFAVVTFYGILLYCVIFNKRVDP